MASFSTTGWAPAASLTVKARDALGNATGANVGPGATADTNGAATLTGLADATNYVATDGTRTVNFRTTAAAPVTTPPVWTPSVDGLLLAAYEPINVQTGGLLTAGQIFVQKIPVPQSVTVTDLLVLVQTAGVTLTAGQCFGGLYSSAGALIAKTAEQSSQWQSLGEKPMPLTAESGQSLVLQGGAGAFVYTALLANGTTAPQMFRASGNHTTASANVGLSSNLRFATTTAGNTSLPSSLPALVSDPKTIWTGLR